MSFERLPLALALSLTLLGGNLFLGLSGQAALATPLTEGQRSCSLLSLDDDRTILIAAKDTDDSSSDSTSKDKKAAAKEEKTAGKKSKAANDKDDKSDKDSKTARDSKDSKDQKETKTAKEGKDSKDQKESKTAKDSKDSKDQKESKSTKDNKEAKDSKKAGADDKGGQDKKAQKAEKSAAKETAEEGGDKKKAKGGFFHRRNNADEEKTSAETVSQPASPSKKESAEELEAAKTKAEAKAPPVFVPDDALISVLKDIHKALTDGQTEQVAKLENFNERMILGLSQEIFDKALSEPNLTANRIVPKEEEHQVRSALTAESWSSGDIVVSDKLHGSMAAVWAKRIGGLLTVTIAGDAGDRKSPDGNPIGEFMVVITAHSPVQSGFDIQSQGDVTFWMGKLNNIMIEANCIPSADAAASSDKPETSSSADTASPSPPGGEAKKKSITCISPLLTNRYRKHYELVLAAYQVAEREASKIALAVDSAESRGEAMAGDDSKEDGASEKTSSKDAAKESDKEADNDSSKESAKETTKEASREAGGNPGGKGDTAKGAGSSDESQIAMSATGVKAAQGESTATSAQTIVDAGPHFHLPSPSSTLLMPERALAGQYVTVCLLDRGRAPESNVELSFNGASLSTDASGQAVYQIPDDTTPGRSLNIALSARPDEVPATIEVLQPLNITTGQPPRLDRMSPLAIKDCIMTVDGHNFDGMAHNNSVIVDGSMEGKIVSASPFQLKLLLPQGLRPGPHSLCVSTDGMRSNLGGFDYADTLVTVDGKDSGKENSNVKLLVKVIGTSAKMNVKILNQTPDVIRLNRGAEMTVTSSGGFDNLIQLPAVRAKKGAFTIETKIEM